MTDTPSSRAAELAAQQVESIVAAAQAAGDEIKDDARRTAEHEAERLRADARREAQALLDGARRESEEVREEARRAAETRVRVAEEAAERVLDEARALSGGLRRLGETLTEQGGRILRDVQAAHRRMQADLRVASPSEEQAERAGGSTDRRFDRAPTGERGNPLEGLEVPSWVGRRG